jgi:hypothetical protein
VVLSEIVVKGLVVSNVPPPLLGFNNNVRHRGRIFHIQTEDSGVKNPRIVTHLFADGGRIIKTTRTEYTEHITRSDIQVYVRSLMKEQHKGMFTALRLGELDTLLESVCGPFELPMQVSKAPPPNMSAPPPSAVFVTEPAPAPDAESESPPPSASFDGEERPSEVARRRKRALSNPNLRKVTPSVPPPNAAAFELDVAALERLPAKPAAQEQPRAGSQEPTKPAANRGQRQPAAEPVASFVALRRWAVEDRAIDLW